MSTLTNTELRLLVKQREQAEGVMISKKEVLTILQDELIRVDIKNNLIVDRIDGIALKNIINNINKLP